jgi:hypothetical protein
MDPGAAIGRFFLRARRAFAPYFGPSSQQSKDSMIENSNIPRKPLAALEWRTLVGTNGSLFSHKQVETL